MHNPYKQQPDAAFWSRFVARNWDPLRLRQDIRLIRKDDRVASLGSCFAANLIPFLRDSGFTYIQEEPPHSAFGELPEDAFSYARFSAAYGNIYTVRQFRQMLDRVDGTFRPVEDRWHIGHEVIDPFRPGLRYRARSDIEFDALSRVHLDAVRRVFETATVVIFTLGLTEAWRSKIDGAVFPACPGSVAGEFDPDRHEFHNFTVSEIVADLDYVAGRLMRGRPERRMILTVSPVPLVATATAGNVLEATLYSKSVLRAACGEFVAKTRNCSYFPAYEIITGPQAPREFYEPDRRNVSKAGVAEVMRVLLANCEDASPVVPQGEAEGESLGQELSRRLQQIECEEEASEL